MVIKYRLGFSDASDDYAYLASQILKNKNANVIKTDDEIIIYLEGTEDEIKSAFVLLGEELPLSLHLSAQSVEEAAMMPPNRQPLKEASYLAMYPYDARDLIDDKSEKCCDLGNINLAIDGNPVCGKDVVKEMMGLVVSKLKDGINVGIKNERDNFVVSSVKTNDAFMITNLTERNLLGFDISVDEALSLSAMERPFILKLLNDVSKLVCFANDAVTLLLSKAATDMGIDALFIHKDEVADVRIEYSGALMDAPSRGVVSFNGSDRFFLNEDFAADKIQDAGALFFDLNVSDSFGVYAIKDNVGSKKILSSDFFRNGIWSEISANFEFGEKLCTNFKSSFAERFAAINSLEIANLPQVEAFFAATAAVLGLNGGFEAMALLANKADIAGGVKLDFVLSRDENGDVSLNLKKCFMSMLSYKIAGVEDEVLAYSFFESAVDFLIISQDEVKKSFEIGKLYVGGEFLLSKVFVSKLKSKITNIDIDMALNSLSPKQKGLYESAR